MKPIKHLHVLFLLACSLLIAACTSSGSECVDNSDCLSTHYCANGGGVFFGTGICTIRSSATSSQDPLEDIDALEDTEISDDADNTSDAPQILDDFDVDAPFQNDVAVNEDVETDSTSQTEPDILQDDECQIDSDCGPGQVGIWSECTFSDTCTNSGLQTRPRTLVQCQNGFCLSDSIIESQECTRDTTGERCGNENPAPIWEECQYENECSKTGTCYGIIPYMQCKEGTCSEPHNVGIGNTNRCDRITIGNSCTATGGFRGTCTNGGICKVTYIPIDPEPI